MSELHQRTVRQLSEGLAAGEFSSVELTKHYLQRIERYKGSAEAGINCFITVTSDQALQQAEAADQRRASGDAGALLGVPMAHKDIFCTEGVLTSCGSRMLSNFVSPYDATVVRKMADAGLISLGKLNMDEFAMGSTSENSHYGPVRNPWNLAHVPGGSSGGSAAAVAAQLVPAATGTDTGGSIRQPAGFCGISGIKPTYGVSRYGMVSYASSFDQGGPMARTAEDCAWLLGAMAGFDARDSTSIEHPIDDYVSGLNGDIKGLRIGLPKAFFGEGLDAEIGDAIQAAAEQLKKLGAELVEVDLPNLSLSVPAYYVLAPAEASSNLSRFDGVRFGHRCDAPADLEDLYKRSRAEGFSDEVKRRIMIGTYALSAGYYDAYYLKAQKLRRIIADDFNKAFEQCDMLIGPVAPSTAFRLGEKSNDPVAMYLSDIYTLSANLAGIPGVALPCGQHAGLPIGMQLLGPHWSEAQLLNAAHQYQCHSEWHTATPTIDA